LLALNNYTTIILNITFVSYLDSQFSQARLLTLRIYTCTSQMCVGPITSSYKHHARRTSYTLIYSTGTSSTLAKTYYQRMAIFWKKICPPYHTTSVYRCMAIFLWKKWVQRTILRRCTSVWLLFGKISVCSTILRRITMAVFWKKYFHSAILRRMSLYGQKIGPPYHTTSVYQKRGKMVRCRIRKKWLDVVYTKNEEKYLDVI
jgi:hypothetical protein